MRKNYVTAICLAGLSILASCSKTETTTPSSNAPSVSYPTDANGAMAAVKVITTQTVAGYVVPIEIGTAVAWFGSASNFKDAGTVTCDGNTLSKSNNAYVYTPSQTSPEGLSFSSSTAWAASGNSSNNINSFSYTDVSNFPYISDISGGDDVLTTGSFTLSASSYVSGDSVIFVVSGPKKTITAIEHGAVSSHTFSAAEMASVGTTGGKTGLVQIAPYRVNGQTINGKKYYFVKEACVSKFVNLK